MGAGTVVGSIPYRRGEADQNDALSNAFDVIHSRRSVRKYKITPIPDGDIMKILDAARMAPTAGNQQPWKFLVIRDKAKIEELKDACIRMSVEGFKARGNPTDDEIEATRERAVTYYTNILAAPVYIVILTDNQSKYPTYNHHDGPLAAGYLMLAARALGYGTVYFTDSIPEKVTKEVLRIPDRYTRVCITPVGIPDGWPETPAKKSLDEFIAYESIEE